KHLDHGCLAAAIGSKKTEDLAFLHSEAHVIDGRDLSKTPPKMFGDDGRFSGILLRDSHELTSRFQFYVRGHSRQNAPSGIVDADFDPEHLMNSLLARLDVARQEFGLLIDLFHDTLENLFREGIDAHFRFLAELHAADLRLRNIDAHVNLILLEERGDRSIRRDQITGTDVEDFDSGSGRGNHLALAETRF